MIEPAMQLGVAGIMGVLWVWERLHSRKRERELTEAHELLTREREQLRVLIRLVHRNTRAIERFEKTQSQFNLLIQRYHDEWPRPRKPQVQT